MTVSFRAFSSSAECTICRETMKDKDTVAHSGAGKMHPLHRACLKIWLQTASACPFCRSPVDLNSLFTLQEREVRDLRLASNGPLFRPVDAGLLELLEIYAAAGRATTEAGRIVLEELTARQEVDERVLDLFLSYREAVKIEVNAGRIAVDAGRELGNLEIQVALLVLSRKLSVRNNEIIKLIDVRLVEQIRLLKAKKRRLFAGEVVVVGAIVVAVVGGMFNKMFFNQD